MINTYPEYYSKFKCIADRCPDSCCEMWEVVVDEDALEFYNSQTGEMAERIKSAAEKDGEDFCFKNKENKCPFLNGSKLCEIYIEYGEDKIPQTCKKYPRFTADFGGNIEHGLSLSCSVACGLILGNDNKMKFFSSFSDELPYPNDIDAEEYINIKKLRQEIFSRIECDTEEGYIAFAKEKCTYKEEINIDLTKLNILTDEWKRILSSEDREKFGLGEEEKKKVFHYFVYRYLLLGAIEDTWEDKLRFCIFCYESIIKLCRKDNPFTVCRLFSKEIEHCEENIRIIINSLK